VHFELLLAWGWIDFQGVYNSKKGEQQQIIEDMHAKLGHFNE
jgi:hypothetical protein